MCSSRPSHRHWCVSFSLYCAAQTNVHTQHAGHDARDQRRLHVTVRSRYPIGLSTVLKPTPDGARTPQELLGVTYAEVEADAAPIPVRARPSASADLAQPKRVVLGELPQYHLTLIFQSSGVCAWTKDSILRSKRKTKSEKSDALARALSTDAARE